MSLQKACIRVLTEGLCKILTERVRRLTQGLCKILTECVRKLTEGFCNILTEGLCKSLTKRRRRLTEGLCTSLYTRLAKKAYLRYLPKACIRVITNGLCKKGL